MGMTNTDIINSLRACGEKLIPCCDNCKIGKGNGCYDRLMLAAANIIEELTVENAVEKLPEPPKKCENEKVDHPLHYQGGIECIDYIESLGMGKGFCLGSAIKYIHRAGSKAGETESDDLEKAAWYINRYIEKLRDRQ